MRYSLIGILGIVAMFAACSQTVSASSDDEVISLASSSSKKGKSSSSKDSGKISSSSTEKQAGSSSSNKPNDEKLSSSSVAEELDENCVGEPGNPWDGTTAKDFACGAGTKLSPYIILTAEQLAHLSFVVNASDKDYQGKYFKLGADIKLNKGDIIDEKGALVGDSTKLHKWTPIGNASVSFDGVFDGAGYTVSGIFINTTSNNNGLFGNSSGTIQNVIVDNSWIMGGGASAGVLGHLKGAGLVKNTVNKASVVGIGNITGGVIGNYETVCCNNKVGTVENVENRGVVTGPKTVGGIIGNAQSIRISDARNYAEIQGTSNTGGVAGYLGPNSILNNVANYAKIIGKENTAGIAGYFGYWLNCGTTDKQGVMTNAKNSGKIEGEKYTAGIVGENECSKNINVANDAEIVASSYVAGLFGHSKNSITESAYNMGDVYGSIYVGGITGYNEIGVSQSVYSTGKVDGDSLVGLMIGYNYNTTMADYYYLEQGEQEPFGLNNSGGVATPKSTDEMKSDKFAELLGDEFVYDFGLNNGYPVLSWEME